MAQGTAAQIRSYLSRSPMRCELRKEKHSLGWNKEIILIYALSTSLLNLLKENI